MAVEGSMLLAQAAELQPIRFIAHLTAAVGLYSPGMTGCSASARQSRVLPVRLGPTTQIFSVRSDIPV